MSSIQISDLNPAGSDLFAGNESFLTDLQDNDSKSIFGGGKKGHGKKGHGKKGGSDSSGGGKGGGHGYGGGCGCYGGGKHGGGSSS
jgi:hypothetical protein